MYTKIFLASKITLSAPLKQNYWLAFIEYLKRFYDGSKNSCTSVYTKIFLTSRNHFIYLSKSRLKEERVEQFCSVSKNSCTFVYTKIFLASKITLSAPLKQNYWLAFIEYLKRFYDGSKNSCTSVYTKIFLTSRNHFIYLSKSRLKEERVEQFCSVSKNSCTFVYTKIFLASKTTLSAPLKQNYRLAFIEYLKRFYDGSKCNYYKQQTVYRRVKWLKK